MPARRRHKTKTAQVQAIAERNKKYYDENRERLLAQKRTKYKRQSAKSRKEKKAEREEKVRKEWEDVVHAEHLERSTEPTGIEQLRDLEERINRRLGFGNGSGYMERLFQEFLSYRESQPSTDDTSPLELPTKVFGAMLDALAKVGNVVLNEYGTGKEWNECKRLTLRVRYLVQCIDEFEITLLEEKELGGKSLEEKFLEAEFMFQRCLISAWLDRASVKDYVRSLDIDQSDPPQPSAGFKPLFF